MKQFLFSLLLFIGTSSLFAQSIYWEDDFTSNTNKWLITNEDSIKSEMVDGYYYIERLKSSLSHLFWVPVPIDPYKDFVIEQDIQQLSGVERFGFGLSWGIEDPNNAHYFVITKSGYFQIYTYEKGTYKPIVKWTATSHISPNDINKLKIECRNNRLHYFINGQEVADSPNLTFFDNKLGIIVTNRMSVAVDKMLVRQDWPPINQMQDNIYQSLNKRFLNRTINSDAHEIEPRISPDGSYLFFVRKNHPLNIGGESAGDDIWYAQLKDDGSFGLPINIGSPINNEHNNSIISISADNNTLLLNNVYNEDGSMSVGLSISHRTENGWSFPEKVSIDDYYNTSKYSEAHLSANQQYLLLTIEREDSKGEKDVYVCFKKPGKYSFTTPKNLGETVNTFTDEVSPFLAADNKTLFYATSGKSGYGSHDVFMTQRLDSTWTNWSEPVNLGPSINTTGWEAYYIADAKGKYAYMVSNIDRASTDIIQIELPENQQTNPVLIVKGRVLDQETKEPLAADISYEILPSGKIAGIGRSNPIDGTYKIILPEAQHFGYYAEVPGYFSVNENLDINEITNHSEIEVDLYMVPITNEQAIVINNIFFAQSKYELLPASYPELDRLVRILLNNPEIEIEVSGHTTNQGPKKLNIELSEKRAEAVKDYLVAHGIAKKRITTKGYGPTRPIADNSDPALRLKNRRVEFKVIK